MDGARLVSVAPALLETPAQPEADGATNETLVSGSLTPREPRPTMPVHRSATGDLEGPAFTLALSLGDKALVGCILAERYKLEALIGRGGMGVVYRARHLLLDRPVAVKLLRPQYLADERAVQRFMREAQAMARVEHPNAVTIHDFGILPDGAAYLVMEFIEGETLRTVLGRARALSLGDAVAVAQQVCGAVEAAHRQGVVHRDLKPENIMFKKAEEGVVVKVVDFGLAKLVDGSIGPGKEEITSANDLFGTPAYMAPEFYDGDEIDRRADVYAIGIILYEMLAGAPPFQGTVQTIMSGHLFKEPPPIGEVADLHDAVERVVRKALRKAPGERYESAADLAAGLNEAASTALGYDTVAVPDLQAKPITSGALSADAAPRGEAGEAPSTSDEVETLGRPVTGPTGAVGELPAAYPNVAPEGRRRAFAAAGALATVAALAGIIFAASGLIPASEQGPGREAAANVTAPLAAPAPPAPAPPPAEPPKAAEAPPRGRPASARRAPRAESVAAARADRVADTRKSGEAAKKAEAKPADEKKKKKRRWFNPFSW